MYINRNQKKQFVIKRISFLAILLITVILITTLLTYCKAGKQKRQEKAESLEREVTISGEKYVEKSNIKTYLLIGEDESGVKEKKTEVNGQGQCDFLQLLVIDKENKTYSSIPINRNTICDVKSLDENGKELTTSKLQISYAHTKGDGMESSCQNVVDSVSNLFYDIPIDEYCCVDMDAIGILNRHAGGIDIDIEEDLTEADPAFTKGARVHLTDEQAEKFVRARMTVSDGTNESRMRRQETFLTALKQNYMEKTKADEEFPIRVYQDMEPYMVTSLSMGDISRLAKSFMTSTDQGKMEIKGTVGEDEYGLATFEPKQESLDQIATTLLYEKAE